MKSQSLENDNKQFSPHPQKLDEIKSKIQTDMADINRWVEEFNHKPQIIIVGNYFGDSLLNNEQICVLDYPFLEDHALINKNFNALKQNNLVIQNP